MRRLIVNADDFGLTDGINRAVATLHGSGALSSATLMADAPRFAEAVALAKQHSSLGVGCHIVLVDGSPVADPSSISSLLDSASNPAGAAGFHPTLGGFVRDLYMGRISRADMEHEATAQIVRLQRAGVNITHIDTHKHTHMFPAVLDAVTRAAVACGVRAIRNPFEPTWSVAATPGAAPVRKLQVRLLDRFRGHFSRVVREREFATTDGCMGVLATGTLDETTLRSLLNRMPEGTWELVCHPAYFDDELRTTRTRLQQSRQVELSALQSVPGILTEVEGRVTQIHFGQL